MQVGMICHNYGFEPLSFGTQEMQRSFAMIRATVLKRPDTLFILRTHCGRREDSVDVETKKAFGDLPNVMSSQRHAGLWKFLSIYDILPTVERVVSHPSTVILDAIYSDRPVAVLDNLWPDLNTLHRIDAPGSLEAFLDMADPMAMARPLLRIFGHVDTNLDRAASHAEPLLLDGPQ